MARICIVTPSALGSNPRVVKEADALAEAGHTVRVISTRVLDFVDRRDEDILASAAWSADRIDLRRPLVRALTRLLGRFAGSPEKGDNLFTPALLRRAQAWPADLYIAHYVAALPAAAAAAERHGAALAYDAEDFHPGDPPDGSAHDAERAGIRAIESRYIGRCAYVTAAAPLIAEAYAETYGIPTPTVILNVFPLADSVGAATTTQPVEWPSIYWFSQTIGPERGLEDALRAIALATSRPHLYLRGTPAAGYREQLNDLARTKGVLGHLHWLEPAAPSAMIRLAAKYDVGLVAETGATLNRRIALTNKQFTYLLGGLPVLMSDTPGHRRFAAQAEGAVFIFEGPADLARQLDALFGDPPALRAARLEALRLGQSRYNWDLEKPALVAIVETTLSSGGR